MSVGYTDSNNSLKCFIDQAIIVAYKESTKSLEDVLNKWCLNVDVIRQQDHPSLSAFSGTYRALLNHKTAWEKAAKEMKYALIFEGDFVPVVEFEKLPLPFDPSQSNFGIAWIYTCLPRMHDVDKNGFILGFSTTVVAYIVNSHSAKCLIDFANEIENKSDNKRGFFGWDSDVDGFLRSCGLNNYIAFRNYGEHGGFPKPELARNKIKWAGVHRADAMYGKLAFMPEYATATKYPRISYFRERLLAHLKGTIRLLIGKYLSFQICKRSLHPFKLIFYAIKRELTFTL